MIVPNKHLGHDRAILGVGAEILVQLDEDRTVSELWERVRSAHNGSVPMSFDWFVISLTFLYAISAIDMLDGVITSGPTR